MSNQLEIVQAEMNSLLYDAANLAFRAKALGVDLSRLLTLLLESDAVKLQPPLPQLTSKQPEVDKNPIDFSPDNFVRGFSDSMLGKLVLFFEALSKGSLSSDQLCELFGLSSTRYIAGNFTTHVKRRCKFLNIELPFIQLPNGDGTMWFETNLYKSKSICSAASAELKRREKLK